MPRILGILTQANRAASKIRPAERLSVKDVPPKVQAGLTHRYRGPGGEFIPIDAAEVRDDAQRNRISINDTPKGDTEILTKVRGRQPIPGNQARRKGRRGLPTEKKNGQGKRVDHQVTRVAVAESSHEGVGWALIWTPARRGLR
jgi:hypothetical protein